MTIRGKEVPYVEQIFLPIDSEKGFPSRKNTSQWKKLNIVIKGKSFAFRIKFEF